MQLLISVITCTHNPNFQNLNRVLTSIMHQTLSFNQWEYVVIDNASKQNLSDLIDVSWHPASRIIREETLGLTPARIRGITEAKADILIFIDDDNVIESNYLEVVLQISQNYPFIGAWGGQIKPLFESDPPPWITPYLPILAIRQFDQDKWSNLLTSYETTPCGAGLCVRRTVAKKYIEYLQTDDLRKNLGRKGKLLISCEDSDIALTSCDIGLGTGQFTKLKMGHIIDDFRCQEDYLLNLQENLAFSHFLLRKIRHLPLPTISLKEEIKTHGRQLFMNAREKRFDKARQRGIKRAIEYWTQRQI